MPHDEKLSHRATAVIRNQIDGRYSQLLQKLGKHCNLRLWRNALTLADLRVSQRKEVRGNTSTVRCKPLDSPTPLKTVQRKTMQKHRGGSVSALYICNSPEACFHVPPLGLKRGSIHRGHLGSAKRGG